MRKQTIILEGHVRLKKPVKLRKEIKKKFQIVNPEFNYICTNRYGRDYKKWPKDVILSKTKVNGHWERVPVHKWEQYWERDRGDILLPHGSLTHLQRFYGAKGVSIKIIDQRYTLPSIPLKFHGKLKPKKGQLAVVKHKGPVGMILAPTGSGKTVMSLWYAAKLGQPFIVAVPTKVLLKQWIKRINQFLKIPVNKIGIFGDGKYNPQPVSVGIYKTVLDRPECLEGFGLLMIDECHKAGCASYLKIVNAYKGQNLLSMSANKKRRDHKTRVMFWALGKIETKINYHDAERCPCKVKFIPTEFDSEINFRSRDYTKGIGEIKADEKRNKLIIDTAIKNIEIFGVHLIISTGVEHLKELYNLLPDHLQLISELVIGEVKETAREKIVKKMSQNKLKFIFATDKILGTGFDEAFLSVLHLAIPYKVKDEDGGDLKQFIGRITRILEGSKRKKWAWIFDYFDKNLSYFRECAKTRSDYYKRMDIKKEK